MEQIFCHLCNAQNITKLASYNSFKRITSDCKLWPKGGRLGICLSCGTIQKIIDEKWQSDVRKVYDDYTMYEQGNGSEQLVFGETTEKGVSRSAHIL